MSIDDDFLKREYNLQFEQEQFEASLTLEVVDDVIAENDEIFIVYTSIIEGPDDRCAIAVLLQDNDGEKIIVCTIMHTMHMHVYTCNRNNPWWVCMHRPTLILYFSCSH